LAEVIASKEVVRFALDDTVTLKQSVLESLISPSTRDVGAAYGGAVTLRKDATRSGAVEVTIDPTDIRARLQEAPTPTLGETVAHELMGHAVGFVRNPTIDAAKTNRMAVDAENEARRRGSQRGRRTTHPGGL
jgi:hypothetical protein